MGGGGFRAGESYQALDDLLRRFNALPPEGVRRYRMPRTEEEYKKPPPGTGSGPKKPEGDIGYMNIVPPVPENYPPTSPSMGAARPGSGVYRTERPETQYLRPLPPAPGPGILDMLSRVNTGIVPPNIAPRDDLGTLFWWLPEMQKNSQRSFGF